MGLGAYPEVSLADARETAVEWRKMAKLGKDPIKVRRAEKRAAERNMHLLDNVARDAYESRKAELKGEYLACCEIDLRVADNIASYDLVLSQCKSNSPWAHRAQRQARRGAKALIFYFLCSSRRLSCVRVYWLPFQGVTFATFPFWFCVAQRPFRSSSLQRAMFCPLGFLLQQLPLQTSWFWSILPLVGSPTQAQNFVLRCAGPQRMFQFQQPFYPSNSGTFPSLTMNIGALTSSEP